MEQRTTISKVGIRYGLITAVLLIIYGLVLQFTGLYTNQALTWISYLIIAVMVYLAHTAYKDGGDGYMSIGQGLGIGVLLSLVAGVLSSLFSFLYLKFVDDSMIGKIKEMQIEKMEESGMDDATIDQAMNTVDKMMTPSMMLLMGVLGMLFIGFIISLIISLFTKKSNPQPQI
jgi:hypothetical protein